MHQAGSVQPSPIMHLHLTTDDNPFLLLCFVDKHLKERRKKNKLTFCLVATLLPWHCWRKMLPVSLAGATLEKKKVTPKTHS